jgi:hypothetical protein
MNERGLSIDHTTLYRWVQHYAPLLKNKLEWYQKRYSTHWHIDETYGDAKQVNENMRAYILLNAAHTNPLVDETKESTQYFKEGNYENIHLLPFVLYDRRIYRKVVGGYSVHETGTDGKAESAHDDLERICNLTGYKKNMFCLQAILEAARDKLKQIERES